MPAGRGEGSVTSLSQAGLQEACFQVSILSSGMIQAAVTHSGWERGTKAGCRQPAEPLWLSQRFVSKGADTAGPHHADAEEVVTSAFELRK